MNITLFKDQWLEQVTDLWLKSFVLHKDLDSTYYRSPSEELRREIQGFLRSSLNDEKYFIYCAHQNSALMGFIICEESPDPSSKERDQFDCIIHRFGDILELYVSDEARRSGLGRRLMNKAEQAFKMRGIRVMRLMASAHNQEAIAFYQSLGYEVRQLTFLRHLNDERK